MAESGYKDLFGILNKAAPELFFTFEIFVRFLFAVSPLMKKPLTSAQPKQSQQSKVSLFLCVGTRTSLFTSWRLGR